MDYGVIAAMLVWNFVRQKQGRLWLEFLPGIRSRTQPDGISVGTLEGARVAELKQMCKLYFLTDP